MNEWRGREYIMLPRRLRPANQASPSTHCFPLRTLPGAYPYCRGTTRPFLPATKAHKETKKRHAIFYDTLTNRADSLRPVSASESATRDSEEHRPLLSSLHDLGRLQHARGELDEAEQAASGSREQGSGSQRKQGAGIQWEQGAVTNQHAAGGRQPVEQLWGEFAVG